MPDIDYERDRKIDPLALDVEWLGQPDLAMKYGKHLVDIRMREELAHERLKVVRSEIIIEVNEDPEGTLGKAKPNAADIEAYYRVQKKYKEAKEEWIKAKAELEFAEIAFKEISVTRKRSLENLVTLHGQMYFAGPKVPRDLGKEWAEKQKTVASNKKIKMTRTRKKGERE